MRDERYKELSQIVGTTMAAANPVYSTVWQAADEAMSLVGELLAAKPDEQLGYYQAGYTNLFDDLGMGKHPSNRPTLEAGRVRLGYEINVM